jgi:hypothetical protein
MIAEMTAADMEAAKRDKLVADKGFKIYCNIDD